MNYMNYIRPVPIDKLEEELEKILKSPKESWKAYFKDVIMRMITLDSGNGMLWYSHFFTKCQYEFDLSPDFTASAHFNGNKFVITVNPGFLMAIGMDASIAVLKHEAGHIMYNHFTRGDQQWKINPGITNTAMDITINGDRDRPYIRNLPSSKDQPDAPIKAIFYQVLDEKYKIERFEKKQTFEYYFDLILKDGEKQEQKEGQGQGQKGSPGNGSSCGSKPDGSPLTDEEIKELAKQIAERLKSGDIGIDNHDKSMEKQKSIPMDKGTLEKLADMVAKEMIDNATTKSRGFCPSEAIAAKVAIEKRRSSKDWRKVFRHTIGTAVSSVRRIATQSRQHPILPDDPDVFGYKRDKKPSMGLVLDVSGSMGNDLISKVVAEIQDVQRMQGMPESTMIQVDTDVKSIGKLTSFSKEITRSGNGGTIMEPGFKAMLSLPKDKIPGIIVCMTDGEIESRFDEVVIPPHVKVVWLIPENGKLNFDTSLYPSNQMYVIKLEGKDKIKASFEEALLPTQTQEDENGFFLKR